MNSHLLRRLVFTFVLLALTALLSGCVVGGGYGYGYDDGSYGATYYEPSAPYYGGWGHDYFVGPVRGGGGEHRATEGRGRTAAPAFRAAPASHSAPSIPSRARSGGPSPGGKRGR
jgi:hypothetical protein